jgi:phage terminase large subunit-like protein
MTGQYPKWWTGKRFNKPTRGWIVGVTAQLVRDGPQRQLTAKQGEFGTGTIPLAAFAGKPVMVPGGTGSIDTITIAHETDGTRDGLSTATFKSFEQGAEKMQSESIDWIWVDERCSEEIYSQLIARTTATDGIVFLSYTPLKGGGKIINEASADAGFALLATIVVACLLGSLAAAGVITMTLALLLLGVAWIGGVGATFVLPHPPTPRNKIIFAVFLPLCFQ